VTIVFFCVRGKVKPMKKQDKTAPPSPPALPNRQARFADWAMI
jgi:hypothetical protein